MKAGSEGPNGPGSDFTRDLILRIVGAHKSIEWVGTPGGPITTFMLQTAGYMVDNHLLIRGLVLIPGARGQASTEVPGEQEFLEAISTHNSYGWEIQTRASAIDAEFLVIDGDLVLSVVNASPSRRMLRVSTRQDDAAGARELFGVLWRDPAVLEYESIAAQSGDDARRLVLLPSEEALDQLLIQLNRNPARVHSLTAREFEQLVARILDELGFEVKLTPITRDGGYDMIARYRTPSGDVLYLVECKRYAPERTVGISVVRGLYGVIVDQCATAGMVVTSSRFSLDARKFAARHQYKMNLHDYDSLQEWVRSLVDRRAG